PACTAPWTALCVTVGGYRFGQGTVAQAFLGKGDERVFHIFQGDEHCLLIAGEGGLLASRLHLNIGADASSIKPRPDEPRPEGQGTGAGAKQAADVVAP